MNLNLLRDIFKIFYFFLQAKNLYDGSSNTKILEPDDVAQACIYATSQPAYVAINEILIEPREAPI